MGTFTCAAYVGSVRAYSRASDLDCVVQDDSVYYCLYVLLLLLVYCCLFVLRLVVMFILMCYYCSLIYLCGAGRPLALCLQNPGREPAGDSGRQPGLLSLRIRWTKTKSLQEGHDVAPGHRLHQLLPVVLHHLYRQHSGI